MTERFGKIGQGWGWEAGEPKTVTLPTGDVMILVSVSVWTEKREHIFGGFTGGAMLVSNNRVDDDAGKKATTDALTKAFSHLGLSADVFMSKFKDNKYTNKPESNGGVTLPPSGQGGSSGVSSLHSEPPASITPKNKICRAQVQARGSIGQDDGTDQWCQRLSRVMRDIESMGHAC